MVDAALTKGDQAAAVRALREGRALGTTPELRAEPASVHLDQMAELLIHSRLDEPFIAPAAELDSALLDQQRVLPQQEQVFGPSHPVVGDTLRRIACVYLQQCKLPEARASLERSLAILQPSLESTEIAYARALRVRAGISSALWNEQDASRDLDAAITILSRHELEIPDELLDLLVSSAFSRRELHEPAEQRRALESARALATRQSIRASSAFSLVMAYPEGTDSTAIASALHLLTCSSGPPGNLINMYPVVEPTSDQSRGPRCSSFSGKISNADRVVHSMGGAFRDCYNARLRVDGNLQGRIRAMARIGEDGHVLVVRGVAVGLPVETCQCVSDVVLKATFSTPQGGGATISIPVTFALAK
jgi:hypothetical protein